MNVLLLKTSIASGSAYPGTAFSSLSGVSILLLGISIDSGLVTATTSSALLGMKVSLLWTSIDPGSVYLATAPGGL